MVIIKTIWETRLEVAIIGFVQEINEAINFVKFGN